MLTRRLALRKETLTALTPGDLAGVAGASATGPTYGCPTNRSCLPCLIAPSYDPPTACEGEITFRTAC